MSKNKKIFYLITRGERGGAQTHLLNLIDGVIDNYEIVIGAGEQDPLLDICKEKGCKTYFLPSLTNRYSVADLIRTITQLKIIITEEKPDLIHLHSAKSGLVGRMAAWRNNIPVIYTIHGWGFVTGIDIFQRVATFLIEFLFSFMIDLHIVVSDYDYRAAKKYHIHSKRMVIINNGIKDTTSLISTKKNQPLRVITIARFAPPKDYQTLIEALKFIETDFELVLVGDGPDRERIGILTNEIRPGIKICFMGIMDGIEVLLADSDLFVLSSKKEGLPISIIEAMRAGLPIVATEVGGIPELIDEQCGIRIPTHSPRQLGKAISELLENTEKRKLMGLNARKIFENKFTMEKMTSATLIEYEQLLNTDV